MSMSFRTTFTGFLPSCSELDSIFIGRPLSFEKLFIELDFGFTEFYRVLSSFNGPSRADELSFKFHSVIVSFDIFRGCQRVFERLLLGFYRVVVSSTRFSPVVR